MGILPVQFKQTQSLKKCVIKQNVNKAATNHLLFTNDYNMNTTENKYKSQRNFRKIPEYVQLKLNSFADESFVVACVKKVSEREILAGNFSKIGISVTNGNLDFPKTQIPLPSNGRFSRINSQGLEIVRNDLPKITKSYAMEVPNFGDWSKGSHTVTWSREVYQREFLAPKQLEIEIELLGEEELANDKVFVFRFTVSETLNKKKSLANNDFLVKNDLFFNLNLLQESVGAADVFPSVATRADYLSSLYVNWEILPVGEKESTVDRILSGVKAPTPELRRKIAERYDLLFKLNPTFIKGVSGLRRYFGAVFADNLVVFEHLEYGNAIYVMFEDWKTLSKLTRPQLLSGERKGFERIVHRKGWENKLLNLLKEKQIKLAA